MAVSNNRNYQSNIKGKTLPRTRLRVYSLNLVEVQNYLRNGAPSYLLNSIRKPSTSFYTKLYYSFFRNNYFPATSIEWYKLDPDIRDCPSCLIKKKRVLEFIRPYPNVFKSHLRKHKCHNFEESLNPSYDCGKNTDTITHFLLHCKGFMYERQTLPQNIKEIESNLLSLNDNSSTPTLYGDKRYTVTLTL